MKIKFKTRMIVVNILIAMVAIALICLVVTQGIWYYSLNNYVNNLRITANEASLMISQSMRLSLIHIFCAAGPEHAWLGSLCSSDIPRHARHHTVYGLPHHYASRYYGSGPDCNQSRD